MGVFLHRGVVCVGCTGRGKSGMYLLTFSAPGDQAEDDDEAVHYQRSGRVVRMGFCLRALLSLRTRCQYL